MESKALIKNIDFAKPLELEGLVDYQDGQVVSRTFAQSPHLSFTLFAFSAGEGLSAHTVAADAFVQVLDGQAKITIGDQVHTVQKGQVVVMPQGVPHSVEARQRFKMLLLVIKQPQPIQPKL